MTVNKLGWRSFFIPYIRENDLLTEIYCYYKNLNQVK